MRGRGAAESATSQSSSNLRRPRGSTACLREAAPDALRPRCRRVRVCRSAAIPFRSPRFALRESPPPAPEVANRTRPCSGRSDTYAREARFGASARRPDRSPDRARPCAQSFVSAGPSPPAAPWRWRPRRSPERDEGGDGCQARWSGCCPPSRSHAGVRRLGEDRRQAGYDSRTRSR